MSGALSAQQAFYPAAALYGAVVLPASVIGMTGGAGASRQGPWLLAAAGCWAAAFALLPALFWRHRSRIGQSHNR